MPLQDSYPTLTTPDSTTFVTGFYMSGDVQQTVKIPSTFVYGSKLTVGSGAPSTPGVGVGDVYIDQNSGDVYQWNTTTSSWGSPVFNLTNTLMNITAWCQGKPTASQILTSYEASSTIAFSSGSGAGVASCDTAPTANAVLNLLKNGTSFGTITFNAGTTTGFLSIASNTVLNDGDVFDIVAPTSQDSTFANVRVTMTVLMASGIGVSAVLEQALLKANNLSDLVSVTSARTNLGLAGSGSTRPVSPYLNQLWRDTSLSGTYGQMIMCAQVTPSIVWINAMGVAV